MITSEGAPAIGDRASDHTSADIMLEKKPWHRPSITVLEIRTTMAGTAVFDDLEGFS